MKQIALLALVVVLAFAFVLARQPPRDDELVRLEPGPGYVEHPLDDERVPAHSSSYLRRDLMRAVQAAAVAVGSGAPVELGDMSERDGSTPGRWAGRPRHPPHTHVGGRDIDIAYFQVGTLDNRIRPICEHVVAGVDQHHCIGSPLHLDVDRTARFIAALFASGHVRSIGVDGVAGPILDAALARLGCRARLAYETRDGNRGWFYDHHNHLHVSWRSADRD